MVTKQGDTQAGLPHAEWNFRLLALDGVLFFAAFAFMDPNTLLPAFVGTLTNSSLLIGLIVTIRSGGWLMPQLIAANYIEQLPLKKTMLLRFGFLSRVAVVALAIVVAGANMLPAPLVLTLFFVLFSTFNLCEGASTVAWVDIIGKTLPPGRRGALFTQMQFFGNLLGLGGGLVVKAVLDSDRLGFPGNYALLLFLAAFVYILEYVALYNLREDPVEASTEKRSLMAYFRSMPQLVARSPQFARVAAIRILLGCNSLVLPFYAVYGQKELALEPGMLGVFLSLMTVGTMAGSLVFGRVSDHLGNRRVIQLTAATALLAPVAAIGTIGLIGLRGPSGLAPLYSLVFVFLGFSQSGMMLGFTNYLLEIVSEQERPSYYGLLNAMTAPTSLLPLLGGSIVAVFSFPAALTVAIMLLAAGFGLTLRLPEPRHTAHTDQPGDPLAESGS